MKTHSSLHAGGNASRDKTTPIRPENLKLLVAERLGDPVLRKNLKRATGLSLTKRDAVVRDYDRWEEMRKLAHEIKKRVINNLPEYLDRFERQAEAAGANVIYASDAAEARKKVLEIVEKSGASLVVKGKSMTSEEIELTPALENNGIKTLETDLGEYIIQLAGEIPSHITAPALHKSREQIGRLFADELGIDYTSDPEELTEIARETLRDTFLNADLGITGVNFAIAETGTICIVENEGNIRLSSTLPKVHIAIMGIEKLLPDHRCLSLFLNLLGRSGTGQRITSYTSLITGPRKDADHDGPDELYIIVLDNKRTAMLAEPGLREALYCIRCGACMNVCPVYQKIGGHSYGSIYGGPIGSVITPVFFGERSSKELPYASSLCGSCSEICPVQIDIHHQLLWWRQRIVSDGHSPPIERLIMKLFLFAARHETIFDLSGAMARMISPLLKDAQGGLRVPIWSRTRWFPPMPETSFKQLWKEKKR